MIIKSEMSLNNFEWWSGAKDNASYLTYDEMEELERELEEGFDEGIDETKLNDLMWFDFDWLCDLIGLDSDEVLEREV